MALRAAMHRAGAAALTELLRTTAPVEMAVSCRCGHPARYHQMRPKQLLTVLGRLEIERAYYSARIVTRARVRATGNWTWKAPSVRPACAA